MLGLVDDVTAFALDEALAMRLDVEQLAALAEHKGGDPPAGLRFATPADVDDWATSEGED